MELNFFFKNNQATDKSTFNVYFTGNETFTFSFTGLKIFFGLISLIIICLTCARKAYKCVKKKIV